MAFGNNLGKQTELVKQAILAYIWDQRLEIGDRVPSQSVLCAKLGIGCATVARAVRALVAEGILESRHGVGVFVKTAEPEGHPGHSIGLVGMIGDNANMFNWVLNYAIQSRLQREGCQCTIFPFREHYVPQPELSEFPGLETHIASRGLQGIVTITELSGKALAALKHAGIPVCYAGPPQAMPSGVILDTVGFIENALRDLRARGRCRPAILIGPCSETMRNEVFAKTAEILDAWKSCTASRDSILYEGFGIPAGCEIADRMFKMKPEERPDGLIMCDDIMAMGFYAELIRRQSPKLEYLPPMVILRNKHIDIDVPATGVIAYENDIDAASQLVIDMLLNQLRGKEVAGRLVRQIPARKD